MGHRWHSWGNRSGNALENEDAFFVPDPEVGFAVAIDVDGGELGSGSGVGVEEVGDETGTLGIAGKFIPVEDGRFLGSTSQKISLAERFAFLQFRQGLFAPQIALAISSPPCFL